MLRTRVITALLLLALIVPAMIFDPAWLWSGLMLCFLTLAAFEWWRLRVAPDAAPVAGSMSPAGGRSAFARALPFTALVAACGGLWLLAKGRWPELADQVALVLMVLAVVYWVVMAPLRLRHLPLSAGPAIVALVVLLACWLALVELRELGPLVLFAAMSVVWGADIGAYFVGRAVGRRKLAPSISPGKSWEGVFGGMFFVIIVAFIAAAAPVMADTLPARLVGTTGPVPAALVLAGLCLLSVVGDLYESALKRAAGVKDSGQTLPGHGGVLDRIDGLIPVMPCIALLHRVLT